MSLLSQLSKSLSVAVGIEDIMGYPSPRALAARIGSLAKPNAVIPRVEGLAVYPVASPAAHLSSCKSCTRAVSL